MSLGSIQTKASRPLLIQFDQYTDGDQPFKKVLIVLMTADLKEIQDSILIDMQQNTMDTFTKTFHKIDATITMLNDFELAESLQAVKSEFFTPKRDEAICKFIFLSNDVITSLRLEALKE
jgi:hypothetical protein